MNTNITTDKKIIEETYIKEVNSGEGIIKFDIEDFQSPNRLYQPFALATAEGDQPITELVSAAMDKINEAGPQDMRSAIISIFHKDETCIKLDEMLDLREYLDSVISDPMGYKWGISKDSCLSPGMKRVRVYAFGML